MKFGVCCGVNNALTLKNAGYDYIEANFTSITTLSEQDFDAMLTEAGSLALPVYATNCFFPGDIDLYGEGAQQRVSEYAARGFSRVAKLGVKMCVIGSGKARNIPDGEDRAVIEQKFTDLLSVLGELAMPYGIKIAIEPLSFNETNFINKVGEAVALAEKCGKSNVGALVDFFHFHMNGEADDGLLCAKGRLFHAHIARPNDRQMPTENELPILEKWAALLAEIGYDGTLSLEGGYGKDFQQTLENTRPLLSVFGKKQ